MEKELIRLYRFLFGLTQSELSRECGMSQPWIHQFENGNKELETPSLILIARSLGLDPSALGVGATDDEVRNTALEAVTHWLTEVGLSVQDKPV